MAIKNMILQVLIDGVTYDAMVKTSGEMVYLTDEITASAKIAEMVAAINLRAKTTDVEQMIADIPQASDGISPTIEVVETEDGYSITITDVNGEQTVELKHGSSGKDGVDGKDAYEYAKDGGYTGTETEFAARMAQAIPSKTSDITNDSGFITKAVADLTNYYLKSETYTQSEINAKISAIPKFAIQVVSALPTSGISTTTVYLLKSGDESQNLYTEYIYANNVWEKLGTQTVDLTGYALKSDVPTKLSALTNDAGFITNAVANLVNYYSKTEVDAKFGGTVEITSGNPAKSGTVLTIDPSTEEVNIYTAEEVDAKFAAIGVPEDGEDGVSPTVAVADIDGGHRITITDAEGEKTVDVMDGEDGSDATVTADSIKSALGYTPADASVVSGLSEEIANYLPKNQGSANVGKILVVGTDGNLTLTEMPEAGVSGDVIGTLDESNNILLTGNLADGTYTLKYENADGSYSEIGTLEVGAIVTYTITQNLSAVTSDNATASVRNGESFTTNLTANDGYELSSVTVTMGGTDITSSAVSGGNINITSVTGDIVITAVAEEIKVMEPITENIALTDGIRIGSDGTDRTIAGHCATPQIDLTNIPKPCTIHLTKAKWAYASSSETGTIMYYAWTADGGRLVGGYTNDTIGNGYFTLVRNGGKNTDVTVTVTSNEVAKIRFAGAWSNGDVRDDYGFSDWDTNMHAEATLTYTPVA